MNGKAKAALGAAVFVAALLVKQFAPRPPWAQSPPLTRQQKARQTYLNIARPWLQGYPTKYVIAIGRDDTCSNAWGYPLDVVFQGEPKVAQRMAAAAQVAFAHSCHGRSR